MPPIPQPRLPAPAENGRYDAENEAQFRRAVENTLRRLLELATTEDAFASFYTKEEVDDLIDAIVTPALTAADIAAGTFPGASYTFAGSVDVTGSLTSDGTVQADALVGIDATLSGDVDAGGFVRAGTYVQAPALRVASDAGSTLGSVTGKVEVFDFTGASLGFLPLYDSIT